jgi:hypothetical protein
MSAFVPVSAEEEPSGLKLRLISCNFTNDIYDIAGEEDTRIERMLRILTNCPNGVIQLSTDDLHVIQLQEVFDPTPEDSGIPGWEYIKGEITRLLPKETCVEFRKSPYIQDSKFNLCTVLFSRLSIAIAESPDNGNELGAPYYSAEKDRDRDTLSNKEYNTKYKPDKDTEAKKKSKGWFGVRVQIDGFEIDLYNCHLPLSNLCMWMDANIAMFKYIDKLSKGKRVITSGDFNTRSLPRNLMLTLFNGDDFNMKEPTIGLEKAFMDKINGANVTQAHKEIRETDFYTLLPVISTAHDGDEIGWVTAPSEDHPIKQNAITLVSELIKYNPDFFTENLLDTIEATYKCDSGTYIDYAKSKKGEGGLERRLLGIADQSRCNANGLLRYKCSTIKEDFYPSDHKAIIALYLLTEQKASGGKSRKRRSKRTRKRRSKRTKKRRR